MAGHKKKDSRDPWERQTGEEGKAWYLFVEYRDADPWDRSLSKLAEKHDFPIENIKRMAQNRSWKKRAQAWDDKIDQRKRRGTLVAVEKMKERQKTLGVNMQKIGGIELNKLAKIIQENPSDPKLSAKMIVKIIQEGANLERLNMDEPTSINKEKGELKIVWEEQHADSDTDSDS